MQSARNKTRKASVVSDQEASAPQPPPVPQPPPAPQPAPASAPSTSTAPAPAKPEVYGENPGLETFLNVNASEAFCRPWHRLERGLRLNRIRAFIAAEKAKLNLSDADTEALTNLLHRSLDKKLLNSKSAVVYSMETQEIQEIKGLIYHTNSDGRVLSQIVEKKGGVTFRKPH
uniref:Uncharacterized protein n=1 Tax=viral metagenome TaxID=1070528 RepID=A0A6C0L7Z5_9ZZZZ